MTLVFAVAGVIHGIQAVEKSRFIKRDSHQLFFLYTSFVDQVIATPTQTQDYFGCFGNVVPCVRAYAVEIPFTRVPAEDIFDSLP